MGALLITSSMSLLESTPSAKDAATSWGENLNRERQAIRIRAGCRPSPPAAGRLQEKHRAWEKPSDQIHTTL